MKPKQVIVVRRDLKMPEGKLASQVAHASLGALLSQFDKTNRLGGTIYSKMAGNGTAIYRWLEDKFTKVVLGCDNLEEIQEIYQKTLSYPNIPCALIEDSGDTIFNGIPTITTLGIGPDWSEHIDLITGHLKLY